MSQPYRTIQLQRDTAANWTSANTLLAEGELGLEMDTRKAKIGDGVTNWNSLSYAFSDVGSGDMLKSENLSGLTNYTTARSNLGLGSLATQDGTFSGTSSGTNTGDDATNTTSNAYALITPDFYQYSIVRSVGNLVVNNSFEVDLSGWSGWLSSSFTRVTSQFYNGTASAQIITDGTTYAQGCYCAVTTKVGFQYAYSVYVKGTAGKQITMLIDGGTVPEYYQTLTGGWDRITGSVTATTTNTSIYIQCVTAGVTTYWVDAVQVEEGTTVAGPFTTTQGNLTVALKNYEGNDPTPTKPVKYKTQDGIVRTITSATSFTLNAGTSYFNAGSAELATKEIDYFVYIIDGGAGGAFQNIGICRVPNRRNLAEVAYGGNLEKYMEQAGNTGTENCTLIGRFNATLSAGPGYTWSIPATSVIVNRPIHHTNHIFQNVIVGDGTNTATLTVNGSNYQIDNQYLRITLDVFITNKNSCSGAVRVRTPFSVSGLSGTHALSGGFKGGLGGIGTPIVYSNDIRFLSSSSGFSELQWSAVTNGDRFIVTGFYPI